MKKVVGLRSTRAGARQQMASRAMLPRTAPCWRKLASGKQCGWAAVQLDYDEGLELLHGMCGSMEEFEVQRTIERALLTAFCAFLEKYVAHQDSRGQQRNNRCRLVA